MSRLLDSWLWMMWRRACPGSETGSSALSLMTTTTPLLLQLWLLLLRLQPENQIHLPLVPSPRMDENINKFTFTFGLIYTNRQCHVFDKRHLWGSFIFEWKRMRKWRRFQPVACFQSVYLYYSDSSSNKDQRKNHFCFRSNINEPLIFMTLRVDSTKRLHLIPFRAHLHRASESMLRQLCDDTSDTVLIENNGVTQKWIQTHSGVTLLFQMRTVLQEWSKFSQHWLWCLV